MKAHYSIISAQTRPEVHERIIIGLLLISQIKPYFAISKNKLSIVRTLVAKPLFQFLHDTIRQISDAVEKENDYKQLLFSSEEVDHKFSEKYLEYLSRYSNNLVNVSAPVRLDMEIDESVFNMLFCKYVDQLGVAPQEKAIRSVERIKESFYPEVTKYYNTDKTISKKELPGLPMAVNVDLIGKNKKPVFAQIIDFERPVYNIRQDVSAIQFLHDAYGENQSMAFLIGNEPDKSIYPNSHDAWSDLRQWKTASFVEIQEIEKLKKYAIEHNVTPLFAENIQPS